MTTGTYIICIIIFALLIKTALSLFCHINITGVPIFFFDMGKLKFCHKKHNKRVYTRFI